MIIMRNSSFLLAFLLTALPCAAQIAQERATLSAGGGTLTAPQYTLTGTVGQASPVGVLTSTTYTLQAGVWAGKSFALSVVLAGPGSGTVKDCATDETCAGERINCGSDCLEFYTDGESVLLRAFPDDGAAFDGWLVNGAPPDGSALYMTRDVVVTATFIGAGDRDNDALPDDWEQQIIDADSFDAIITIADVMPNADFDGDGLTNAEECLNATDPVHETQIVTDITMRDAANDAPLTETQGMLPFRVAIQLAALPDRRPVKLVRNVTLRATNATRFDSERVTAGWFIAQRDFPGHIDVRTNENGTCVIEAMSLSAGYTAISVEGMTTIQGAPGGGATLPRVYALQAGSASFLNAAWNGRQVVFPPGAESLEVRLADLIEVMEPGLSGLRGTTWTIGGITFDRMRIGKTGYLLLGDQPELPAATLTWDAAPDGLLAPFLDDLVFTPESKVFLNWEWRMEPYLTIEWCRMAHTLDPTASYRFQMQLWQQSGLVRFVYDRMQNGAGAYADGRAALIGMKFGEDRVFPWTAPLRSYRSVDFLETTAASVAVWMPNDDHDYLTRQEEARIGTDPANWDTDGDRMNDGWEHTFLPKGIDPLRPDADGDLDGDGYANLIEYYLGSRPDDPNSPNYPASNPDTDKDGMPDAWETQHGLNPQSAADATIDTDHDWYCNVLEYTIGGDPTDPSAHGNHPFEPNGGMSHAVYP